MFKNAYEVTSYSIRGFWLSLFDIYKTNNTIPEVQTGELVFF